MRIFDSFSTAVVSFFAIVGLESEEFEDVDVENP